MAPSKSVKHRVIKHIEYIIISRNLTVEIKDKADIYVRIYTRYIHIITNCEKPVRGLI